MGYPAWMILLHQALEVISKAGAVLQAIGDFEKIRDVRDKTQALVDAALTMRGLTSGLVEGPSGGQATPRPMQAQPGLDLDIPLPEEREDL